MKSVVKSFPDAKYLLLAIAVTLTTLHVQLVWRSDHNELIEPSLLCWAAAWFIGWKRDWTRLESGLAASCAGMLTIAWILLRSASLVGYDSFLRFAPVLSGISIALLASGFPRLKSYWRELAILGFLAIPTTTLMAAFDISPLTASFAGNLLWYTGHPVTQQGVNLILPNGTVEVYTGCSGIQLIFQLLTLMFLFVMLFPITRLQTIVLPIVAILIGFVVNGVRVALMAVLHANAAREAFDYWHLGTGSMIFSMIAVGILGGLCYFLLEWAERSEQANAEEEVEA